MSENQSQDIELLKQLKGVEYRQYEFLIVTALGVLGFSVERFDVSLTHRYIWILIISWLALMTSVLEGFFQVQWRLAVDVAQFRKRPIRADISRYKQALLGLASIIDEEDGSRISAEVLKAEAEKKTATLAKANEAIKNLSDSIYTWTQVQVWSFYTGIILLVVFKILNTI